MSSCGAKNVLRKDIVTHDVFFQSNGFWCFFKSLIILQQRIYNLTIKIYLLKPLQKAVWNQIFRWKYLDVWDNISCSSPQIAALRVANFCIIACYVYNWNLMNVSRSMTQLMFFPEDLEGLRLTNATKTSNQQFFDFVDVPSFVSLFTGNPA